MSDIVDKNEVPAHVSSAGRLDFSGDFFVDRLAGPWIGLGAWLKDSEASANQLDHILATRAGENHWLTVVHEE